MIKSPDLSSLSIQRIRELFLEGLLTIGEYEQGIHDCIQAERIYQQSLPEFLKEQA